MVIDGCSLFRKNRQGKKRGGIVLYIKVMYICSKVQYEVVGRLLESYWVEFRGEKSMKNIMVGICYRSPNQEEKRDKDIFKTISGVGSHRGSESLGHLLQGNHSSA